MSNAIDVEAIGDNELATEGDMDWLASGRNTVLQIPVSVKIVLGSTKMPVSKLMDLSRGSVIPLDRKVGEPVDIVVNDRIIARGEVIVLDGAGPRFAVSITEVVGGKSAS
ncbi:MAG: flagellar motor switch protein FliN [Pseudomonadota bacterium]